MKDDDYLRLAERKAGRLAGALSAARSAVNRELIAIKRAKQRAADARQAQAIVQGVGQHVQEQVHKQIAAVVTRCLKTVFQDEAYSFRIIFERKRGKTDARLAFFENEVEIDPIKEGAGGQVDVAALALRLACLLLIRPPLRRVLILDEPFRNVNGAKYQARVGQLITDLASEMNIQFIIVTDDDWLQIGKVIRL